MARLPRRIRGIASSWSRAKAPASVGNGRRDRRLLRRETESKSLGPSGVQMRRAAWTSNQGARVARRSVLAEMATSSVQRTKLFLASNAFDQPSIHTWGARNDRYRSPTAIQYRMICRCASFTTARAREADQPRRPRRESYLAAERSVPRGGS